MEMWLFLLLPCVLLGLPLQLLTQVSNNKGGWGGEGGRAVGLTIPLCYSFSEFGLKVYLLKFHI